MRPLVAAALALALAGCPARPTPVTLPPTPAVSHFAPHAARALRDGPRGEIAFAASGEVTRDGVLVARIAAHEITAPDGRTLATLAPDGTVRVNGAPRTLRLSHRALSRDDGARITLGDDGAITVRDAGGEIAGAPWHIVGAQPGEDLGAALLTLLLLDGLDPAQR